jgi:hypothetical protein
VIRRQRRARPIVAAAAAALIASLVGGSPVARPATVSAVAPPSPVARWSFDEASGSTVAEAVGGLNGTLSGGVTRVAGANGSAHAVQFNGTDGLVTVANAAALEPAGNFTISMWVRGGVASENVQHTILQKGSYGCDLGASYRLYQIYQDPYWSNINADTALTTFGYPVSANYQQVPSIWNDTWHHVFLVVDDTADTSTGWIDGYKWAAGWPGPDTVRFGSTGRVDDKLYFGGPGAACDYWKPFNGAIDEVEIYGSALTDAQILATYPVHSTTTTMAVFDQSVCCNVQVTTALTDHENLFRSETTPAPGADANVTWYVSKDGGPEEIVGTSVPIWNNGSVPAARVAFLSRPAGSMAPGSYTARAVWEGTPNWTTSSSAPYAFTVVARPVTMTLAAAPNNTLPGGGTTLTARLAVDDPPATYAITGNVEFHETTGGGDVLLGTGALSYVGNPHWNQATYAVAGLTAGAHTYEARYAGTTTLAAATATTGATAGPQRAIPYLEVSPNPVLNTAHATATVTHIPQWKDLQNGTLPDPTGTVSLKRVSTGAIIATQPVTGVGPYSFEVPIYPTGTVALVATYSGDADYDAESGNPVDLVIQSDVVEATGVGIAYPTFYPVTDGYRDSVAAKGVRNEPASVAIKVYNSANKVVRTLSVATGSGAYSAAWNGRTSTGTLLPAGTYKIRQTLTDGKGIHLVVDKSVALSWKKLVYATTTITKYADAASSVGYEGSGYAVKYADHSVKAFAAGGWVGIGWQLALPTATTYKSLSIGMYGTSGTPIAHFGSQNFSWCAYSSLWYEGCFDHMTAMRSTSAGLGWASRAISPTYNRYGRTVRINFSQTSGSARIYKVRVVVTYGILK